MKYILIFLLVLVFFACKTYNETDKQNFQSTIENYIDSLSLDFQVLENGLYYNIINKGDSGFGKIKPTDRITFTYIGSFLDGEVFQEIDKNEPITFKVIELISGWQDGLSMISKNGEIELIIPPHLAYGDKKTGLIPPNSILKYKLKILEVE